MYDTKTVMDASNNLILEMNGIVKTFPGVIANDHIDFSVREGEIMSLLGENGAGKTTLMNILYALYEADEGTIKIGGREVKLKNPHDSMANGIGMVHQHFMLIPNFTVSENIILGNEPTVFGIKTDNSKMKSRVKEISEQYNLKIDPDALIENLPVGIQQRVEILKILYRGADILILDEPTAVLTPQEVSELFDTLRLLRKQGKTIIIITHKLKECMILSDRITVLRRGKLVGVTKTSEVRSVEDLAEMMIGRRMLEFQKEEKSLGKLLLRVSNLSVNDELGLEAVKDLSFDLHAGEILGIAGVVGNGQRELAEGIFGIRNINHGQIQFYDENYEEPITIRPNNPRAVTNLGISFIPEDRQKTGSVGDFTIAENLILSLQHKRKYRRAGFLRSFLNWDYIYDKARKLVKRFDIRTPSIYTKIKSLSGGNQQKVIVAREFSKEPEIIIAAQPTRGLDVGVIEYVHSQLLDMRGKRKAILLISSELDEILSLSDRIAVIYEGKIVAYEDPNKTNEKRLGLLMAGHALNEVN